MNPDFEETLMIVLMALVCIFAGFVFGYMTGMFSQIDPAVFTVGCDL